MVGSGFELGSTPKPRRYLGRPTWRWTLIQLFEFEKWTQLELELWVRQKWVCNKNWATIHCRNEYKCDQIGRFLEFVYKSIPNVWWLFGQLWNPLFFKSKRVRLLFWATFGKTWVTFYFNIWSHWWLLPPSHIVFANRFSVDDAKIP